MRRRFPSRGFNLLELLIALVIGLTLITAFLVVLQRSQRDFTAGESLARLQDSARHAMGVLVNDVEHAGFYGLAGAGSVRLVRAGSAPATGDELAQPGEGRVVPEVGGLPAGAHDCGVNFAVDLRRPVQGSDNHFALGRLAGSPEGREVGSDARDCAPTGTSGGASDVADTLTLRHASLDITAPRAGRLQVYSAARSSTAPLLLFADGQAPGAVDDGEVRDVEIRSYYIANDSVDRRGWPALRVKSLTESRGAAQFRDEEVMPGVEDLQVEFAVVAVEDGQRVVRYVAADSPRAAAESIVAVRLWLRLRSDVTERGHHDDRVLNYANVTFTPTGEEARHRRLLIERTVAVRNAIS